jgi:cysteine desulfurase family protein (TIGR01976 family)
MPTDRRDPPPSPPADPPADRSAPDRFARVRRRFPAVTAGATVFLDNASGAQLPEGVLERMAEALRELQVNKGGAYPASRRVTDAKEEVRARTADFLGVAGDEQGVAFGANATTLLFLLAEAVGDTLRPGDEVVVSGLDHHANRDPWRRLERRGVHVLEWAPRGPEATLDPDDLAELLSDATRVVAMTAASNLLGTHGPVAEVGRMLRDRPARLVVDAVHAAPHALPDARAWGADAVAFSPYKVFAPHLGALWIAAGWRAALPDWGLSFLPSGPLRWEPGTQNHEAILAFGAALDHLAWIGSVAGAAAGTPEREAWRVGYRASEAHERALAAELIAGLDARGARRYGRAGGAGRTATVAFTLPGVAPGEVAAHLGERGVAVAAGHAYAERLAVRHLGLPDGAVRVSLAHYSDRSDLAALFAGLDALP